LPKVGIPRCFGARIQQRFFPMKVLICYYSTYGNVYKMANLVAEGSSQVAGAEPVVRKVPELIPAAVVESRADMKAGRDLQKDIPLVTADDFREAGAIAFGTPTRFGNVSSQLKNQIDQLTSLWLKANSRASRLASSYQRGAFT